MSWPANPMFRVVLYSHNEYDRPKIVSEIRHIINNAEFLKGSTEPPKLVHALQLKSLKVHIVFMAHATCGLQNDFSQIIRLDEVEKRGKVKRVSRTLVLTDTQLLCLRVRITVLLFLSGG